MLFGPQGGWIKAHICGKKHCQFVFYEVAKTKHIPNKNVCGMAGKEKNREILCLKS